MWWAWFLAGAATGIAVLLGGTWLWVWAYARTR